MRIIISSISLCEHGTPSEGIDLRPTEGDPYIIYIKISNNIGIKDELLILKNFSHLPFAILIEAGFARYFHRLVLQFLCHIKSWLKQTSRACLA
jgi:hypothetical protein